MEGIFVTERIRRTKYCPRMTVFPSQIGRNGSEVTTSQSPSRLFTLRNSDTDMKRILDACCGSRMCWFDKHNSEALFMDIRQETTTLCDGRTLEVNPDVVGDFRDMPFENETFHLVLFDPPHLLHLGKSSWLAKKYGRLFPTWENDIKQGFDECMRVLKPNGVLVFKWNEQQIPTDRIIEIIGRKPLFGHTSGKGQHTIWMCFMKEDYNK